MKFTIKKILLWPKDTKFQPREIEFAADELNIISGASRTGKSAIIPIIDYCLGSDGCSIPAGIIRKSSGWFGVLVSTAEGEKLFARREPEDQQSTGDMFVIEEPTVVIPNVVPGKNITRDGAKSILNRLAGLSTLDMEPDSTSGFASRPSFRDLMAFVFQPQNVIANPDIFFYKSNQAEHREKLKNIFPYALGAVSSEALFLKHQIALIDKELNRKQREFDHLREVSQRWVAELQAKLAEAREFGLISYEESQETEREKIIAILQKIPKKAEQKVGANLGTVNEAVRKIALLQEQESDVATILSRLRRRLSEVTKLRSSSSRYEKALGEQSGRLSIAAWLTSVHEHQNKPCPLCGTEMTDAGRQLKRLVKSLRSLEGSLTELKEAPAVLDREVVQIEKHITAEFERLEGIKYRRSQLEQVSEEAKDRQLSDLGASHFAGGIVASLSFYERLDQNSDLRQEIKTLREKRMELAKNLDLQKIDTKTKFAVERIQSESSIFVRGLDAERPQDPIEVLINELNIRVKGPTRSDYLWEIGSGSNWLSYHLAVLLGIHAYLCTLDPAGPIPQFIVFDQPSQVYFPKSRINEAIDMDKLTLKDEDIVAVKKIFTVLSNAVKLFKGKGQIIVVDHASDDIWGDLSNVYLVEEWRTGKALIPDEWK